MNVTQSMLNTQVAVLNSVLGRPANMFSSKVGETTTFSVGHFAVDKNAAGYALEEIKSTGGAAAAHTHRMTAKEMNGFLAGMLIGIGFTKATTVDA